MTRSGARAWCLAVAVTVTLAGCGDDPARTPAMATVPAPPESSAPAAGPATAAGQGSPGSVAGQGSPGSVGAPVTAARAVPAPVTGHRAVSLTGRPLTVFTQASASSPVLVRLPARTAMGSSRVLLVEEIRSGWVKVALPVRPNGRSGWLPASSVRVEATNDLITVNLSARRLTVVVGGRRMANTSVAIGSSANPTPTGTFYVIDRVRPTNPRGAYGKFALGLSAHSPTLTEFGSGDGQVAIHGTNAPSSIGKAVSHGCIRVPADVTAVLARVPLGTPVVIT